MKRVVKNPKERRAEIIATAYQLFASQEYEKITMQSIMNELDIAKGTIYHYFASKEALLQAVVEDIAQKVFDQMQQVIQDTPGSALEKIRALVQMSDISQQNLKLVDQLHRPDHDMLHSRLVMTMLAQQAPLYAELIRQGCKEGIFRTDHPLEAAEFILYAVHILTDVGFYGWTQDDLQRRGKAFPQLIERLLQAPAGSFDFVVARLQ